MSNPVERRELYRQTIGIMGDRYLKEPDIDLFHIWDIYISKGIEGVREAFSPNNTPDAQNGQTTGLPFSE